MLYDFSGFYLISQILFKRITSFRLVSIQPTRKIYTFVKQSFPSLFNYIIKSFFPCEQTLVVLNLKSDEYCMLQNMSVEHRKKEITI